uniref:Uncharacterized protein n=1 Tax=Tanacetum cinerariifolium TaxID=118510 RepID=A0A699VAE7_TANCI|nr:hypothetical protein [Tanacetum cinerariifolium]
MAEENLPAPTRSDEQLVPAKAHLPYRKRNLLVPNRRAVFTLNFDLLRYALEITPVDLANPFVSPLVGEIVMDFVNEIGYPDAIHFVSHMHVDP